MAKNNMNSKKEIKTEGSTKKGFFSRLFESFDKKLENKSKNKSCCKGCDCDKE